jgi:hypothetical protein
MIDATDPRRFLYMAKCEGLRGSMACVVTYRSGLTERVNREYLVHTLRRLGHAQAREFELKLLGSQRRPAVRYFGKSDGE